MNWKLLSIVPAAALIALSFSTGCEVSTCDGDDCGFGGDDNGGGGDDASTGGATSATGGTTSEGGAGGAPDEALDCQEEGVTAGTPGEVNPDAGTCESCLWSLCEDKLATCNAEDPYTACRFGSTSYLDPEGKPMEGEFDCMLQCLKDIDVGDADRGQFDVDECAASCGSTECTDTASEVAQDLALCMLEEGEDLVGCQDECGFVPL